MAAAGQRRNSQSSEYPIQSVATPNPIRKSAWGTTTPVLPGALELGGRGLVGLALALDALDGGGLLEGEVARHIARAGGEVNGHRAARRAGRQGAAATVASKTI